MRGHPVSVRGEFLWAAYGEFRVAAVKVRDLLAEMRALAAQAAPLILAQEQSTAGEIDAQDQKRRSPETAGRPSRHRS
jgi:hypothetical protein